VKLQRVFAPLFNPPPEPKVFLNPAVAMVVLALPVSGWRPPFIQEDAHTWALAGDYPVNGRTVLAAHGTPATEDRFLPVLGRTLEEAPHTLLKDLAPPFSLIWSRKHTGETFVQNDGLGLSQLFEFQSEHLWAVSNKIFAFSALGLPLEPVAEQWAVWATLGWFPQDMTGYRGIRFVEPATRLRLDAQGMSRTRFDVLSGWIYPEPRSPKACLERARSSLLEYLKGCLPLWEKPKVGLTGGWDSRAVVSSLRALGADFSATVRGSSSRHDVVIASELARIAGVKLRVEESEGLPPEAVRACRRSISLALLWQAGHVAHHRHKTFLANRQHLEPRRVNVTGQHGEIGRRERALFRDSQARQIRAEALTETQYEEYTMRELLAELPPFTRRSLHDVVRETIRDAYHQADRYGLTGLARVDFFSLYELTRRKGSARHGWQTRLLVAPFLNPDFIRAVFGYVRRTDPNAFHRYIIATNSPEWADVPYFEELEERNVSREGVDWMEGREPQAEMSSSWKRPWGRENYDGPLYWQQVGKPLIDEALARGGFWTQIFDPDLAGKHWQTNPDALAILYLLPDVLQNYSVDWTSNVEIGRV
jgi:hypothetical protein